MLEALYEAVRANLVIRVSAQVSFETVISVVGVTGVNLGILEIRLPFLEASANAAVNPNPETLNHLKVVLIYLH